MPCAIVAGKSEQSGFLTPCLGSKRPVRRQDENVLFFAEKECARCQKQDNCQNSLFYGAVRKPVLDPRIFSDDPYMRIGSRADSDEKSLVIFLNPPLFFPPHSSSHV